MSQISKWHKNGVLRVITAKLIRRHQEIVKNRYLN
jgi:hypothetical protein